MLGISAEKHKLKKKRNELTQEKDKLISEFASSQSDIRKQRLPMSFLTEAPVGNMSIQKKVQMISLLNLQRMHVIYLLLKQN